MRKWYTFQLLHTSREIGDKYKIWNISSKQRLHIRYIMFARNYAASEAERCLNEFLIKRPNQGAPISCMDELMDKVQKWDNFDRGQRFPTCPEFHQCCLHLMEKISPILRAEFLDKRFAAELTEDNTLKIKCSQAVRDSLLLNRDIFQQLVISKHPNCKVEFNIFTDFW